MFKKDFKSKGQTQVKSSDRKKLRQQLQDVYPRLTDELLSLIVPLGKNDECTSSKLVLSSGEDVMIYLTNKTPWFFIIEDQQAKKDRILPTVYLLWKCPDLIPLKFHTHRQVFSKLFNGADLMLPGLILPPGGVTLQTFRHVQRDDLCSICLDDNRYPVGIGQTTMDGEDMYMSGMKGRGMILLHLYQDTLWNFGPRTEVPYEREEQQLFVMEQSDEASALVTNEIQQLEIEEEKPEGPVENHPESMDEILDAIFFYLCQRKAKNYELPLLASHFYTLMQDCVPGLTLDLKQSSHKKFSKFLQHHQEINHLISLEETKPGVLAITSFNLTNEEQIGRFRTPVWLKTYLNKQSSGSATNTTTDCESSVMKYTFPTVTELWKNNSRVNEILGCSSSTHYFRAEEIRQSVRSYVVRHQLNREKHVELNDVLSRLLKTSKTSVDWNELNHAVFNAMTPTTELIFPHLEQPIRLSGSIQAIELECIDRNRKRQTFIRNLEIYQIDLNDLCKRIRQGASVSAVIDQNERHGRFLMAQGNQIGFVTRLLKEIYLVPNKFIREID